MNIYVIFIYTFILVILKSSNCSDRYSGNSESSDTEDDDNFDVTQSGQPIQPQPDQQHIPVYYGRRTYPPEQSEPQEQHTEPTPISQPQKQHTGTTPIPQPQEQHTGPTPIPQPQQYYEQYYQQYYQQYYEQYYQQYYQQSPTQGTGYYGPQYQQPSYQQEYYSGYYQPTHPHPQPTQQILVTYPGIQYPVYSVPPTHQPYQQHYQPPPIPQQQPYYTGYRPTPTRDPSQVPKEYGQLPGKLISDAKYKEFKKQKELDLIKFYKKSKKGDLVPMTENDYTKVFSNKFMTKYKLKYELEQIVYNKDIVYIHKYEKNYCKLLTYYEKSNKFTLYFNDGAFFYIKQSNGRWKHFAIKPPNYVKLYSKDSEGNDMLLSSEHYYIDLTDKGSIKYTFKIGVRCTKIVVNKLLVWKQRDDHEPIPNAVSVTSKKNVVLDYDNYISVYSFIRGRFMRLRTKPNKEDFNEY